MVRRLDVLRHPARRARLPTADLAHLHDRLFDDAGDGDARDTGEGDVVIARARELIDVLAPAPVEAPPVRHRWWCAADEDPRKACDCQDDDEGVDVNVMARAPEGLR